MKIIQSKQSLQEQAKKHTQKECIYNQLLFEYSLQGRENFV